MSFCCPANLGKGMVNHLMLFRYRIAILPGWYRAEKPLDPGNTKKLRKKYKIPHPGLAPENTKKIPKNTKMVIFGPFSYFFGIFFVFSGANPGWGILYFFRNFFVFPGSRVFGLCTSPGRITSIAGYRTIPC